ncbi:hypothetical protein B0I35DRAFT_434841 [Stachybotrys elegans]|uniref:Uncharacterized protein n=1 Tax=Stachybotrys elegans TaxID=80388 RepID=A0A8K0SMY8_9HYPO|nr:hypothetical protein B0I35DRAFT_434841 [Stachybotrys elegans]
MAEAKGGGGRLLLVWLVARPKATLPCHCSRKYLLEIQVLSALRTQFAYLPVGPEVPSSDFVVGGGWWRTARS